MTTTIEQYPLERAKIVKKFIASMINWILLLALIGAISHFVLNNSISSIAAFALIIVAAAWEWVNQTKYYESYFYDATNDFLEIRKGWITPREVTLPYEKLQDVYVDQDLLDRLMGLYDVHVSSATIMSGMEAHIDGVNSANAKAIKALLLEKIKSKKSRVTGYD